MLYTYNFKLFFSYYGSEGNGVKLSKHQKWALVDLAIILNNNKIRVFPKF